MCDELVSFAEFRAILTPFSEVIRKAATKIIGRPTTPSIAGQTSLHKSFSPQQEKSRTARWQHDRCWLPSHKSTTVVLPARSQIQMIQSELRLKPSCEFPLLTARSQASEESRRGEF